jgi:hypothetical protein
VNLTTDDYKRAAGHGVSAPLLCKRMRLGWELERAITQAPKATPVVSAELEEWKQSAVVNGISISTFHWRVRAGWEHKRAATTPVRAWERSYL